MRRATLLTIAALLLPACSDPLESADSLQRLRIVEVRSEPPAIIAPAVVTASVRISDPRFRSAEFRWYLALAFNPETLIEIAERPWADPESAPGLSDGFVAIGTGPTVTVPVPPLPAAQFPEELEFDTIPLPLAVAIVVDGVEYKAFKQVRLVIPELVERGLTRSLGRAPTTAETAEALRVRLNRNPVLDGWDVARVPSSGEFGLDEIVDLKVRRELLPAPLAAPMLPAGSRAALRFEPRLSDPDVRDDDKPGQPGYNYLSGQLLRTAGESYPLTLTSHDWAPLRLEQANLFDPPNLIRDVPPELQTVRWVFTDRQGGTAHKAIEIDLGGPPPAAMRGAAGSLLVQEDGRMLWFAAAADALIEAAEAATGPVRLQARVWYDPQPPLGVTAAVDAISPSPVTEPTSVLDDLDADPARRAGLTAAPVTIDAAVLRVWRP
jgi:hypothetical protein